MRLGRVPRTTLLLVAALLIGSQTGRSADPVAYRVPCSAGELAWGGAASTAFWVDPREHVTAMFFTQLLPSSTHPIRTQLRQLVYQALVD